MVCVSDCRILCPTSPGESVGQSLPTATLLAKHGAHATGRPSSKSGTHLLYRLLDTLITDLMSGTTEKTLEATADFQLAYRVASTASEREQAFRLVYQAYLGSRLVRPNPVEMRILPHHLLSTTEVFVAAEYDRILSTVSLVRDGELGMPMEDIYPEQIAAQRLLGKHLGEVSCLASVANLNLKVCLELFRVMVQAARQRGVDALLVAIHPKHERFYRRYLAFESLGGRTGYPAVCNQPAVALLLDFDRIDAHRPANWQRFFGESLPESALRAVPMSTSDKRHIAWLFQQTGNTRAAEPACATQPSNTTTPVAPVQAISDSASLPYLEPFCVG